MEISALLTLFDEEANQLELRAGVPFSANGVRIPLEILQAPLTGLPIPQIPN